MLHEAGDAGCPPHPGNRFLLPIALSPPFSPDPHLIMLAHPPESALMSPGTIKELPMDTY
ncbi:MAG: hypothetical protein CMP31_02020 [Roseibacillus sp.]|nr:hypothetical protein [Roseibacillus sp.]